MRWMLLGMLVAGIAMPAIGQSRKPWVFEVHRKGKVVGRYDCNVVANDEGIFAVAASYEGPKTLRTPRPGSPSVRCHAELSSNGALGKYKRWKNVGKGGALYWLIFSLDGEIRLRHEGVGKAKPKVTSLGKTEEVHPLEEDQPILAWLLVRKGHEGEFRCVGHRSAAPGKGRLRKVSGEGGGEVWEVEGDCGRVQVEVGPDGEPARFTAGDTVWKRVQSPP